MKNRIEGMPNDPSRFKDVVEELKKKMNVPGENHPNLVRAKSALESGDAESAFRFLNELANDLEDFKDRYARRAREINDLLDDLRKEMQTSE